MMIRGLLTFQVMPNPAKEGQMVTIKFTYPVDKITLTIDILNWDETETRRIKINVTGSKGTGTFVIPKGWGPGLFVSHSSFYTSAIAVRP